jgi:hypothetical protein
VALQEKRRRFGEKTFGVHDSPVTKMLTKQDFQSIYNIFITIMVWLGVNIVLQVRWYLPPPTRCRVRGEGGGSAPAGVLGSQHPPLRRGTGI